MITALLAAFGNAAEVVQSKIILQKYRMPANTLLSLGSVLIFFVMSFLFVFWGDINFGNIRPVHFYLFGAVILVSFFYNFLYYFALKKGDLCDVEPLAMLHPLIAMIIALIFYPEERNFWVVGLALTAAVVLVISRIEKHYFKMKKATAAMLGFVVLISIESNLVKTLLEVFSPVALYTIRIGILATLFLLFVKPNLKKVTPVSFWQTLLVAVVVAVEYWSYYYAIHAIGVVKTSLVMLLAPVLILISSKILFKERFTLKKAIASFVILICIGVAIIIS